MGLFLFCFTFYKKQFKFSELRKKLYSVSNCVLRDRAIAIKIKTGTIKKCLNAFLAIPLFSFCFQKIVLRLDFLLFPYTCMQCKVVWLGLIICLYEGFGLFWWGCVFVCLFQIHFLFDSKKAYYNRETFHLHSTGKVPSFWAKTKLLGFTHIYNILYLFYSDDGTI